MGKVEFLGFEHVNRDELMAIVNEDSLRTHLVEHPYFDCASLQFWMEEKMHIDSLPGCRIRAVYIDGELAGWCGIQPDDKGYELAIVIAQRFWGFGIAIFRSLVGWAGEIGHKEVLFHLLDSRPEYRALKRMSRKVHQTEQLGRRFTTYYIQVGE